MFVFSTTMKRCARIVTLHQGNAQYVCFAVQSSVLNSAAVRNLIVLKPLGYE